MTGDNSVIQAFGDEQIPLKLVIPGDGVRFMESVPKVKAEKQALRNWRSDSDSRSLLC